jgi:hypothetical protein
MGDIKSSEKFSCELCDYNTSRKSQWDRHILTAKHKKETFGLHLDYNLVPTHVFCCSCGNQYKCRQGLWKHKKKCGEKKSTESSAPQTEQSELKILTNLVLDVVKQNQELTNKIVDICKTGQTNNSISHSNINSHNKTFNLHFFLNETCKDAMNIMDFVDSINLQLSDLEQVGKLGYVEGISNIIVKNLNAMDVHKRPVHCADKKREVLYIKDDDKWEKEDDTKQKIRKAIKRVAAKNQRLLPKFKEVHPDCNKYHSKFSDQYNKIIVESMGGSGDNDVEKEDKIIKNISKSVVIDKE